MKLKYVLKGHVNDRYVIVTKRNNLFRFEWSGESITHMIKKYSKEILDYDVLTTSKDRYGNTIIIVR